MFHVIRLLFVMSLLSFLGCGQKSPAPGPDLDGHVHLKSYYYSASHGYHAYSNIGYRAERLEDGQTRIAVLVGNDRERVFVAPGSVMDSLEALVRKYRMNRFKGHYEPKMEVLDGDSWTMELVFTDGSSTYSGGYMAYPPKGAQGIFEAEGILSRWLDLEPAEEVALTAFRFELYDPENGAEVFSAKQYDDYVSFYFRRMGSREGWNYYCAHPDLLPMLAREIRWAHACSYPATGEKLADEDKSRPRWIAIFEYADGQRFELIDYIDRSYDDHRFPTITEMGIRSAAERCFSAEIERIGTLPPEQIGEHSCTSYNAKGEPQRTINYAGDGTVLSGRDYHNPNLDF